MHRRKFGAAAASVLFAPTLVRGQSRKPDKPVTIYNPFAAGGGADIHIRLLGKAGLAKG